MKKVKNILWIDWGTKYVWMAYIVENTSLVMPIGYIINDGSMYYNIWEIISRYNIFRIIVWYPKKQKDIQEEIDEFINQLIKMVPIEIQIDRFDEDYTSVQASATTWNYKKDASSDTLAAMHILEGWMKVN